MATILVTGATGTIGSNVLRRLLGRGGLAVRAAVRSRAAATAVTRAGGAAVDLDLERPAREALEGVDAVFFVTPNMPDPVGASARFIEHAAAAGVKHVVKLSALQCDREPTIAFGRAHQDAEDLLKKSGVAWTLLRPNNFMENFLAIRHGAFAPDARGEIRLPWGEAGCSFIAADDVAAVAEAALTQGGHAGKTYELTGPGALRLDEVAAEMTAATGRAFRYVEASEEETRAQLLGTGLPPPVVGGVLELHAHARSGRAALVTRTVEEVTGSPARAFPVFARANAALWSAR